MEVTAGVTEDRGRGGGGRGGRGRVKVAARVEIQQQQGSEQSCLSAKKEEYNCTAGYDWTGARVEAGWGKQAEFHNGSLARPGLVTEASKSQPPGTHRKKDMLSARLSGVVSGETRRGGRGHMRLEPDDANCVGKCLADATYHLLPSLGSS